MCIHVVQRKRSEEKKETRTHAETRQLVNELRIRIVCDASLCVYADVNCVRSEISEAT